jgi:alkylation response protein AidB-like acyl-CoA dehydrogenase
MLWFSDMSTGVFGCTEAQEMYRREIRSFLAREIAPGANARATLEEAMAKLLSVRTGYTVIHNCLLIHGQVGYSTELPLEQMLRNVIGLGMGDGTADIMKLIISREILGRESLPY